MTISDRLMTEAVLALQLQLGLDMSSSSFGLMGSSP